MSKRTDPRYVDNDSPDAVLEAWQTGSSSELPMGGWTDGDAVAFRQAIEDECGYAAVSAAAIEIMTAGGQDR